MEKIEETMKRRVASCLLLLIFRRDRLIYISTWRAGSVDRLRSTLCRSNWPPGAGHVNLIKREIQSAFFMWRVQWLLNSDSDPERLNWFSKQRDVTKRWPYWTCVCIKVWVSHVTSVMEIVQSIELQHQCRFRLGKLIISVDAHLNRMALQLRGRRDCIFIS